MRISHWCLLTVAWTFITASALARTWHVPEERSTIQAGIDAAAAGDTVLVACGTYYDCTHPSACFEVACVVMKSGVILRSETGDPACATITARQRGRVIYCDNVDSTTAIEGFTIDGGYLSAFCFENSGAGLLCLNSSLRISDCTIANNQVSWESGFGGGASCLAYSHIRFSNCTFTGNIVSYCNNAAGGGGGLVVDDWSEVTLDGCHFIDNWVAEAGAAIHCGASVLNMNQCVISANHVLNGGAGGVSISGSSVHLTECQILDNQVTTIGGGIACSNTSLSLERCVIRNNSAGEEGGGVWLGAAYGSDLTANDCEIIGNFALQFADGHVGSMDSALLVCCDVDLSQWGGLGTITVDNDSCLSTVPLPTQALNGVRLEQNFPNPFNPATSIGFYLPTSFGVKVEVADLRGRVVTVLVNEALSAGHHQVIWRR